MMRKDSGQVKNIPLFLDDNTSYTTDNNANNITDNITALSKDSFGTPYYLDYHL